MAKDGGGSMKKNSKLFGLTAIIVIIIVIVALKGTKQNTFPQGKMETEIQADSQETSALVEETVSEADPDESKVRVSDAESNRQLEKSAPEKKGNRVEESKQLPKLVDLGADSCIPCKMMAPILEELQEEYKGKLDVEFIDVWKQPDAGTGYGIKVIPTQIFFDQKGKEFARHEGFMPKEEILAKFAERGIKLNGE